MTTVGRLAARYGLSRSTLLYYERIGLLLPSGHAKGDYRQYSPSDERRLERILAYRSAGVSLKDIGRILDGAGDSVMADVLEERLGELRREMDTLANQQRVVAGLLGRPELLDDRQAMDKGTWTKLLRAAGFSEDDMRRWHEDFERTAPEKHERFLRFLNIPEEEIALIRSWAMAPHRILNMKHATDRYMELFFRLYEGVERKGPGSPEETAKALRLCRDLPDNPHILDIGCGSGLGTAQMAELSGGTVIAVDYNDGYVQEARAMAERFGLSDRITAKQGDMGNLPYPDRSFDMVWSEGVAYIMGFDAALAQWRRLIKPGGYLVVSEATWMKHDAPEELVAFWKEAYPVMRDVQANEAAARALGYEVVGSFAIAESCWDTFYADLDRHLNTLEGDFAADPDGKVILEMTREEARLWKTYPGWYGYQFYVLKIK